MKVKIDGRADRIDDSNPLANEDVSNSTIMIEEGDVIVSEGPVSFEIVEDSDE